MTDPTVDTATRSGYCECGCGGLTPLAKRNRAERGDVKGQPVRFLAHHGMRITRAAPQRPTADTLKAPALAEELTSEEELWLQVVGYEGLYEVSNQGRVRRIAQKVQTASGADKLVPGRVLALSALSSRSSYKRVVLYRNGVSTNKSVHRLVCEAFRGGCANPELQVRHLNGDGSDNRIENLTWGTVAENAQDNIVLGVNHHLRKTHCRYGHPFSHENTLFTKKGCRVCRTCHRHEQRIGSRRRRAKAKEMGSE